jgi:nicotinamide-nucleotide amidase
MKEMIIKSVIPYLREQYPRQHLHFKVLHFVGFSEQQIDPLLRQMQQKFPTVSSGIYPGFSTLSVHLKSNDEDALLPALAVLQERFAKNLYESPSGTLSEAVHLELLKRKITLATAESCTGGALAASFVVHPGASNYFLGSIVAYANSVKEKLLGVDPKTLQAFGAVSEPVTEEMAVNTRQKLGADLGLSISGILGPSGATPTKPVGTICASIAYKNLPIYSWTETMRGNRQMLLERCVQKLLAQTLLFLREKA